MHLIQTLAYYARGRRGHSRSRDYTEKPIIKLKKFYQVYFSANLLHRRFFF